MLDNRSEMGLHARAMGHARISLKEEDTSGAITVCKKEAERQDKNAIYKVERAKLHHSIPTIRRSPGQDKVQQKNLEGNKSEKPQRQSDTTHVPIQSCERRCDIKTSDASPL